MSWNGVHVTYLAISVGAVLGANLRFLVGGWVHDRLGNDFPWGTFLVNVSGSFLLGVALTLLGERIPAPTWVRHGVAIGFLGSYTTFSTFSYETYTLAREGSWLAAGGNVLGSLTATLVGVSLGVLVGTVIARSMPA